METVQEAGMTETSLYERLGGAFAIGAVVDHFSDAIVHNPTVGRNSENPARREWHTNSLGRLPGLKFEGEVLAAFAAHKGEVTEGYSQ
jgi:hemoglobin